MSAMQPGGTKQTDSAYWVGIDLGTQSAKAIVVTGDGRTVASGQHPISSIRDVAAQRHEQDPDAWTDAVANALAQALGAMSGAQRSRIGGLSLCATSGTIVAVDASGRPTTNGLMYDDGRGARFCEAIREAGKQRWERLGVTVQPSWAICRIAWLFAEGLLPDGHRVVHQGDFVAGSMIGNAVPTDWSSALKSGFDTHALEWPAGVFSGITHRGEPFDVGALPAVVAPGTLIGETDRKWEARCGLPASTPVFAGMTDGCAAQLGAGALSPGDWHTVLGTTLVIKGVTTTPISDGSGAVYSHRAPHDGLWLPGGASNVGAGALTALFPDADPARYERDVAERTGPVTPSYPLMHRGERFPFLAADAEGFALSPDGTLQPLEWVRDLPTPAGIESLWVGVACIERLCFDLIAEKGAPMNGRFSSTGGGTRSMTWNRIRATLLDQPIALPETAEGSLGMAILARWGSAHLQADADAPSTAPTLDHIATSMSRIRTVVDPDPSLSSRLSHAYASLHRAISQKGWI